MNKRYMDFVPKSTTNARKPAVKKPAAVVAPEKVVKEEPKKEPEFGVIEDAKKAASEAKSKKISSRMPVFGKKTAERILGEGLVKSAKKKPDLDDAVLAAAAKKAEKDEKTLNIPKTRFVNTDKITKRPLSKNVYQKKVVVPEEKPMGPVTIISKPEKDSRVGMVVTIIITIILGAAAGTVAFLLLPK